MSILFIRTRWKLVKGSLRTEVIHWRINMIYGEGASLAFANGKYEPRAYPSFAKGGWQCHWGVHWYEWSDQRKSKGTASTAEEVLLEVALCCIPIANPSAASHPAVALAAPKTYCLHLLSEAVQIKPGTDPSSSLSTASSVFGPPGN